MDYSSNASPPPDLPLSKTLTQIDASRRSKDTTILYADVIRELAANASLLEIGAGRAPLFSLDTLKSENIDYIANDILIDELNLLEGRYPHACFNICDPTPEEYHNRFNVVCSKMVLEHVPSGENYYKGVYNLLKPGGVGVALHPVLFSPPFVLNKLLPETLSARILRYFFPNRNNSEFPKFPAHYSYCFATYKHEQRLKDMGFTSAKIIPLYGHNYFYKLPVLREIDHWLSELALRRDIRPLASFALTLVTK